MPYEGFDAEGGAGGDEGPIMNGEREESLAVQFFDVLSTALWRPSSAAANAQVTRR